MPAVKWSRDLAAAARRATRSIFVTVCSASWLPALSRSRLCPPPHGVESLECFGSARLLLELPSGSPMMAAPSSGSSLPKLPTYEELQAERDLKESFAQLVTDHEDIQGLFKKVASQLEATPELGEDHELTNEWDRLFKVCRSAVTFDYLLIEHLSETQEAIQRFTVECESMC